MLVIDPPTAPSCTAQFTAELLVPVTLAVNDWVAPWLTFAVNGERKTRTGTATLFVPPPPQPVTATSSASRTRAPILVFMGASSLPSASDHKSRNVSPGSVVRTE